MVKQERKEFLSGRPTLGRQPTNVSKTVSEVPKKLPGLSKESRRQMLVGTYSWAVRVRSSLSWALSFGVLLGVRALVNCLRGSFISCHRMLCILCLLPELKDTRERGIELVRKYRLRSKWR